MNKKSKKLSFIFMFLFAMLIVEGVYINSTKSMTQESLEKKKVFLEISTLPDLAISTESTALRHRSLSTVFSIYKDDGSLREYFVSTYALSHSHIER
ncbi:MAG: hypothetical protein U9N02_05420 [Campylobacterota bacterium]|nr:hypothetical protein [Campylobacterota bacterium]